LHNNIESHCSCDLETLESRRAVKIHPLRRPALRRPRLPAGPPAARRVLSATQL